MRKIDCLIFLETRTPRSRCWQGWFPWRAVKESLFMSLSLLASCDSLAIFDLPRLGIPLASSWSLPSCSHGLFPVCLSVFKLPFFIRLSAVLD